MSYHVKGGAIEPQEAEAYIRMIQKKHPEQIIKDVTFHVDGEYVDVSYKEKTGERHIKRVFNNA